MTKKSVKVAICVPYYKKAEELKRLLYSIMKQTFTDYIVIITDDSSDFRAKDLIGHLDSRFVYYCNKAQLGPTANCNCAIRLAQQYHPQYIKVMHHDDYFNYDESLQEYVQALDNDAEAIFAFSGSGTNIKTGKENYEVSATKEQIHALREDKYNIVGNNFIGAPSATLVRNVGIMMDENLVWLVDVDWYLKLMEYRHCFVAISKPLVIVGIDGDSVTDYCLKDEDLIQKEYLYLYLKHSAMQDFSYLDQIIRQCIVYFKKERGYWHEDDYLSILRDAVNDGKKICLWGNKKEDDRYKIIKQSGILINCYLDMEKDERAVAAGISCMGLREFEKRKRDYFCIVMLDKAKEVRRMLASKGINSLPYIEKYMKKFN